MNPARPSPLLGPSPVMERLRRRLARVAGSGLPVLVQGETGTGKEVVARQLHAESGRGGAFVPVDCAAIARSLVESELFGHERGAFTGAVSRRDGLVQAANGGTFFLDEVGELPLEAQTRLLRLLESGTYRPVGGEAERRVDLRVVAATWRDLRGMVREGTFREDLFHRLAIVEVELPPLRRRPEDLSPLFEHFLAEAAARLGRTAPGLTPAAWARLAEHPWPGNVRELRNTADYAVALCAGPQVDVEDLPPALRPEARVAQDVPSAFEVDPRLPYMEARRRLLDWFQDRYVLQLLELHGQNVSAAARAAGLDRRSIQRVLARHRRREDP